jgi:hypothetical protein
MPQLAGVEWPAGRIIATHAPGLHYRCDIDRLGGRASRILLGRDNVFVHSGG